MNAEEKFYINSLFTHLNDEIEHIGNIFFTLSCSDEFINEFLTHFNILPSVVLRGSKTPPSTSAFSLIISVNNDINSIEKVELYTKFLKPNGILACEVRNQHFIQSHNKINKTPLSADSNLDKQLSKFNLHPIFREAIGKFSYLHSVSGSNFINKFLQQYGKLFPNSRVYSPYLALIYKQGEYNQNPMRYVSENSLTRRWHRIRERTIYKIKNHKINDYIIATSRHWHRFMGILQNILFIHRYRFYKNILPTIYIRSTHDDKKTLVIAMTYLQIGGVERVMLNIIKGINRDKFTIHLLTTTPSSNPWHDEFMQYVDNIVHIPALLDEAWPEGYRRRYIEQYVIKNNADVLFITNSSAAYHATPAIKKRLNYIHIYDLLHTHGTPRDNDAYLKISVPFDDHIDKRIVIDEYLKTYYVKKYPVNPDKIAVIYNGIDLASLNDKGATKDVLLKNIPKDRKIITFIGRLEDDKSPTRLVDIAIKLKERDIPASIVVVGEGTLGPQMIKAATENNVIDDYIHFYGQSSNPLPLAEHSDFTILVSNAEGIPMSVLESMSVGTPAIASSVGGIPEIIDDTQNGLLVSILDLQNEDQKNNAFVDAISMACNLDTNTYSSMQLSAKMKITERFANMPEIYEHLFETSKVLTEESSKRK